MSLSPTERPCPNCNNPVAAHEQHCGHCGMPMLGTATGGMLWPAPRSGRITDEPTMPTLDDSPTYTGTLLASPASPPGEQTVPAPGGSGGFGMGDVTQAGPPPASVGPSGM